ncbi:MAG TPA: ABC transporter ATP-binding protein [Nitrososphaerales archaeon]|nr:ABC transporter ATP-binding protein [Nitrososphaerales archaeon]
MTATEQPPLLDVDNLSLAYKVGEGIGYVFRNLRMHIELGEMVGLVGESGCGKSSLAYSIIRLLPRNSRILDGRISFEGESLLDKSEAEMRKIRGSKISMVFQDPMTSLNPVFTVEQQMAKVIEVHEGLTKPDARKKVARMLRLVELADIERVMKSYPHELSGGMQQRIMIAMALSLSAKLIIADEPTSAVDATIQLQILQLLMELKKEVGFSVLLITHNLGVVAKTCDRVAVMYAGDIVEEGSASTVMSNPNHPYTKALLQSIPTIAKRQGENRPPLATIEGTAPNIFNIPQGCPFHPRCAYRLDICSSIPPQRAQIDLGHFSSCHLND